MSNPYRVANITNSNGIVIGYQLARLSTTGGEQLTFGRCGGQKALEEVQAECDRRNIEGGHGVQERRVHVRQAVMHRGVRIEPVGESDWQAIRGRGVRAPVRSTVAEAYAVRAQYA